MKFKSFSTYITEEVKSVVFTFGRFNPPTSGHEKLISKVAGIATGNNYRIYSSQSNDPKKNPLDYNTKIKFMRKMFPKHGRNIILDKNIKNALDVLSSLYDQGFTKVTMVVGSDRVNEFSALLNKYNGVKARHGFYNFEDGIKIESAGERDPDSDDVSGMSASKMRAAAAANDYATFSKGLPSGFKDGQEFFDTLRKAMGIKEESEYHKHIQLEPISEKREAFVKGELFDVGDEVIIKESGEIANIVMLGSNYVIVESSSGKYRKWLDAVEKLDEKIKLPQDPDIKDREGSQPKKFFSGMKKSTKTKRDAEFQKRAKMSDSDPRAYKQDIPGDKVETKPSKFTKKFKDMFGEEKIEEGNIESALRKKSEQTGISYGILKKVFDRGVAAWKIGHRPGATPAQWGLARVNSFATGGKTQKTSDADLWKQHKGQ